MNIDNECNRKQTCVRACRRTRERIAMSPRRERIAMSPRRERVAMSPKATNSIAGGNATGWPITIIPTLKGSQPPRGDNNGTNIGHLPGACRLFDQGSSKPYCARDRGRVVLLLRRDSERSGSRLLAAGGTSNHVHLLISFSKNDVFATLMQELKKSTSKWIKTRSAQYFGFQWQDGYGAFSVGASQVPILRSYLARQKLHHQKSSFEEEFVIYS